MNKLFVIALLVMISSCNSVNYSTTDGSVDERIKSFSVSTFQSTAANAPASYGQLFSEDLKDQLLTQTRLELVPDKGDVRFEGSVNSYRVQPIAVSGDNAEQNRLTITISVKFVNMIDPEKNFQSSFTRFSDFDATSDLAAEEDRLLEDINEQITLDIFNKAFGDW